MTEKGVECFGLKDMVRTPPVRPAGCGPGLSGGSVPASPSLKDVRLISCEEETSCSCPAGLETPSGRGGRMGGGEGGRSDTDKRRLTSRR